VKFIFVERRLSYYAPATKRGLNVMFFRLYVRLFVCRQRVLTAAGTYRIGPL